MSFVKVDIAFKTATTRHVALCVHALNCKNVFYFDL